MKMYEAPSALQRWQIVNAYFMKDVTTGKRVPRCWMDAQWSHDAQCQEVSGANPIGLCDTHYEEVKKKYGVFHRMPEAEVGERGEERP